MAQTVVFDGKAAKATIVVPAGSTEAERHAGEELAKWLGEMTGTKIPVTLDAREAPENSIVVGQGALARRLFPNIHWEGLGLEEAVVQTVGHRTLVAGGRPRGTIYAAYRLLARLGCRWWTPWASTIPHRSRLTLPVQNFDERPAFESRDDFWFPAFDGDWAARNGSNGQTARLEEKHGGKVVYAGFVHTYYPLVPPDPYFKLHPEWFSLIDGKRTTDNAQLCTTDPALRDFIVEQVRAELRAHPEATIASVSQNDCFRPCQCDRCQALAKAEGSESAPVLALANYVAERIEKEFPNVAIDTLAYQYTRKAPKTLRPRPNVIVRLCSIECNFGQPLTDPSNASFANDIRDWSRLTNRLYIWNYNTNFGHYPQPVPNYFVLGPNERFFRANGVKGVFEQGAYQSNGGEMSELRAWVQAQLLWNPNQDDKALIDEFLRGYYGKAAMPIWEYLNLMARVAQGETVTIFDPTAKDFLRFQTMAKAEVLWRFAEKMVEKDPTVLWRVRQGHLAVQWVWLSRWVSFRADAQRLAVAWPLPESRKNVADAWLATATGMGPVGWTPMSHINEGGLTPQAWAARFAVDPAPVAPLPGRPSTVPWPTDFDPAGKTVIDLQDDAARLANEPDWAALKADPLASDGIACRMPGSHREWAFQIPLGDIHHGFAPGRWRVLVVARAEGSAGGPTFSAGVWDGAVSKDLGSRTFEAAGAYRTFDLGPIALTSNSTIWIAPPARSDLPAVWIDRVILVKEG